MQHFSTVCILGFVSFWFCIVSLFAAFCCLQLFFVECVLRVFGSASFMYLQRLAVTVHLPIQCDNFCPDTFQCDDVQCDNFCPNTFPYDDFQCENFCPDTF